MPQILTTSMDGRSRATIAIDFACVHNGVVTAVTPATYARWRGSTLGGITEALEVGLVFDRVGDLAGRSVLDVGTGDGTVGAAAQSVRSRPW